MAGTPTEQQRDLLVALHKLGDVIDRVIPDSTSHYAIEELRKLVAATTDPKGKAYAGQIVTNDVKTQLGLR